MAARGSWQGRHKVGGSPVWQASWEPNHAGPLSSDCSRRFSHLSGDKFQEPQAEADSITSPA